MARSKTSQRWLKEHFDDPYVKMAQKDGYRSRASYKLLEIQEKDRILHPGMTVVDLGAAPGGWSQVTSRVIGDKGRLIASDILEMDSIPDVTFIQGDFSDDAVFARILEAIGENPVDLVISDMAPNMSGVRTADQARDVSVRAGAGSRRPGVASGRRFPDQDFPGRRFRSLPQAGPRAVREGADAQAAVLPRSLP